MKILIAFGSSEGQTQKIAKHVADRLQGLGHTPQLYDTSKSPKGLDLKTFDRIIVAGSVHQERHQESLSLFVEARHAELERTPTLFLSVSLSAAFPEGLAEAQGYVDAFLSATGWKPAQTLLVAGALRYDEYDYFKEQIIQHVVLKGRKVDESDRDHEFTDWAAVDAAVDRCIGS
jgi:menaquinone-dependent protoporphyrinogen oxidase